MESNNIFTIDEAAEYMGYSSSYTRSLIHNGKLESTMQPVSEGSGVKKHTITKAACDDFLENAPHRNRREDGRNKYIMYATPKEFRESIRVLKAAGRTTNAVAELIVPANIRKPE